MGTLYDYMVWRGDLSFAQCPLNLVDNVILSNFAYLDMAPAFETEEPADLAATQLQVRRDVRSFKTVTECFFKTHTIQEILTAGRPTREVPGLARRAVDSERFGNIYVSDYLDIVDKEAAEQMCAMVFWLDSDTAYAAFRGTDDTFIGWKEDLSLSYLNETPGQRHAVEFMNRVFGKDCPQRLYVGGHSKGGNLAIYASAFCDAAIRERIVEVYSNDGPGFRKEITGREEYQMLLPKITCILPDSSVVGGLLDNHARELIIKSNVDGVGQHDAFTWEVNGPQFVPSERSASGKFYDDSLYRWLTKLSDNERRLFTDVLFDLLGAGADTVSEFKDAPLRAVIEMIKASAGIDSEIKAKISDILMLLASSGVEALGHATKKKARSIADKLKNPDLPEADDTLEEMTDDTE